MGRWLVAFGVWVGIAQASPAHAGIGSLLKAAVKAGSKAGAAGAKAGAKGGAKVGAAAAKGAAGLGAVALAGDVFRYADDAADVGLYVTRSGDGAVSGVIRSGDELAELRGVPASGLVDEAAAMGDDLDIFVDESMLAHLDELEAADARLYLAKADGPSVPLRRAADGAPQLEVADDLWLEVAEGLRDLALEATLELATRVPDLELLRHRWVDPDCTDDQAAPTVHAAIEQAEAGETVWIAVVGPTPEVDDLVPRAEEARIDMVVASVEDVCRPDGTRVAEPFAGVAAHADLWRAHGGAEGLRAEAVDGEKVVVHAATLVDAHGFADPEPPVWATIVAAFLCFGCPAGVLVVLAGGAVRWFRAGSR